MKYIKFRYSWKSKRWIFIKTSEDALNLMNAWLWLTSYEGNRVK